MGSRPSKNWYPGTEVLVNKFNIKDEKILSELENTLATERLRELYINPLYGSFGMKHLQKIHKYIFQDIYSFAGQIRDETIGKNFTRFAPAGNIIPYGNTIMKQLKNEKFLKGLTKEEFSERCSYYLGEINLLHPFPEGNGRTQREYFRLLGLKNGYEINWSIIGQEEMLSASIKAQLDEKAFVNIFNKIIVNEEPNQELIRQYKSLSKQKELEL